MSDKRYFAKVIEKPYQNASTIKVGIFESQGDSERQIGWYARNYGALFDTFCHFTKNGKDYALYSPSYSATRVIELPSCKDIGGEEQSGEGFCPTGYYVPKPPERYANDKLLANLAFVSGCLWGDDNTWKIQVIDLSEVEKGIIKRDERFGYIELPDNCSLKDVITLEWYYPGEDEPEPYIAIGVQLYFDLTSGKAHRRTKYGMIAMDDFDEDKK